MATESKKFLFTLVFDGDYSIPGTIKFDGKSLDIGNDATSNAAAVKALPPVPNPPGTNPPNPASLNQLEQLAFYQDPDPIPTRVVLTGVARFDEGLYYQLDDAGKPKLLSEAENGNLIIITNDSKGFPTGTAKVVGDFFKPLVEAIVYDHLEKKFELRNESVPLGVSFPQFTWVVIPLPELNNGNGTLESQGMEGISGR